MKDRATDGAAGDAPADASAVEGGRATESSKGPAGGLRRAGLVTALIFGLTGGITGVAAADDDGATAQPDTFEQGSAGQEQ